MWMSDWCGILGKLLVLDFFEKKIIKEKIKYLLKSFAITILIKKMHSSIVMPSIMTQRNKVQLN